MFDTHMHTEFSTDSSMKLESVVKRAKELDIGIIVTEHMDLKYPVAGQFFFDPEEYLKAGAKYRSDKVLFGMEMGLRPDCIEENKRIVDENEFDYIIGSIHVVNGVSVYDPEFHQNRKKEDAFVEYLQYMLECVKKYDFFDSLGHMDYFCRYASFEDSEIYYEEYKELIDEVLRALVQKEKAIEINTARLADKAAAENMLKIYKAYNRLGGRYVTFGSDAHTLDYIGRNMNFARAIAEEAGLKDVYFKERKMCY